MGETDGAPSEDSAETGESEHPFENSARLSAHDDEGKETESGGKEETPDGTASAVDIAEVLGGLALICESGESA